MTEPIHPDDGSVTDNDEQDAEPSGTAPDGGAPNDPSTTAD